jgi:MFS family permease
VTQIDPTPRAVATRRIHPAWWAAAATFLALLGAAAFRATPSVMIEPLRAEFGWSIGTISTALSVNLALFGITAPFAAALMERFGVRRVVSLALLMVAAGSGLTVFMTASWQLVALWGWSSGSARARWRWRWSRPWSGAGSSPAAAWSRESSPRRVRPGS